MPGQNRRELPAVSVYRNETVLFSWPGMARDHGVWQFWNKDAYDDCDFSRAEPVDSYWSSDTAGYFYFGCPVRTHCAHGIRVRVIVLD